MMPISCTKLLCRLLAESNTASTLAAAVKGETHRLQQTAEASHDFSIAAVQASAIHLQQPGAPDAEASLLTALLRAAIACSSSVQLSRQFLAAGLMPAATALLEQGSVHNPQTALAVELLWNLLDSCPVTEAESPSVSSTTLANTGARLQMANVHPKSRLSGEISMDRSQSGTLGSQRAASVTFTADLAAGTSAELDQPESTSWEFAQGSQELTDVDATEAISVADDLAATSRSVTQSRHGASVRFGDLGDDAAVTADADTSRNTSRNPSRNTISRNTSRNLSPNGGSDPPGHPSPGPQEDLQQPPVSDESTAERAASPSFPEVDVDPEKQQLASSLTRLFEDCLEHGYSQVTKLYVFTGVHP